MSAFTFDGVSSTTFNAVVFEKSLYETPAKQYNLTPIPGRNGGIRLTRTRTIILMQRHGVGYRRRRNIDSRLDTSSKRLADGKSRNIAHDASDFDITGSNIIPRSIQKKYLIEAVVESRQSFDAIIADA